MAKREIDKYACSKNVKGVICKAEKKDCDVCPLWKGIGIVPIIKKNRLTIVDR